MVENKNKYFGLRMFWWFIIYGAVFVIFLVIAFLIVFLGEKSWWWVGVTSIIGGIGLIIISVIFLVMHLSRSVPIVTKQDPELVKDKVVEAIKRDEDNPDNFVVHDMAIRNEGNPSEKQTEILHLSGIGYETGDKIDVILNMESPQLKMTRLNNATPEQVKEAIRKSAEKPEVEIVSKTTREFGAYGAREETETRSPLSKAEKEVNEQKEIADTSASF